ncbi:MAG: CinA family nicotinamide mononucleotide deamidase-related protein [Bdellovibrionota bacterium]
MPQLRASIVAIGNELLSGRVTDTNSTAICRKLYRLGIEVTHVTQVKDIHHDIVQELTREAKRADIVVTTGGLGPTSDDLTRETLADLAGVPLEEQPRARAKLEALFAARGRTPSPNNLKQVLFPAGAEVITNRIGTADAFVTRLTVDGRIVPIVSLPGVPREMETIFEEELSTWLERNLPSADSRPLFLSLRCFGRSESYLGLQIESLNLNPVIEVAYRPMFPEILLTFTHIGSGSREERLEELTDAVTHVRELIGPQFVFTDRADETLPAHVGKLLAEKGLTLACAESCTGGLIAHLLVSQAGASQYFASSVVAYSNDAKSVFLGVRPAIIARYGAVSGEVVKEMARGALHRMGTDFAVSISGIAGPDGGTEAKPVGTFWIGIATKSEELAFEQFFPHERDMFRTYGAHLALELLRRKILGYPLTWQRK